MFYKWRVPGEPILQVRKSSLYSRKQATVISDIDSIEDHRCSKSPSASFDRFGEIRNGRISRRLSFANSWSERRNQARIDASKHVCTLQKELLATTLIPRNTTNFSGSSVRRTVLNSSLHEYFTNTRIEFAKNSQSYFEIINWLSESTNSTKSLRTNSIKLKIRSFTGF